MTYGIIKQGSKYTKDYKVYLTKDDKIISPWHDVKLKIDSEVYNVVIEIPRFTNGKFEIDKKEEMNAIKQDVKKGEVRFIHNVYPYKGFPFNYGALPQTFEDPSIIDEQFKTCGDDDPLDFVEIGSVNHEIGDVVQVKILGCLCFIDNNETDYKIIGIDINDKLASSINSMEDVDVHMPGITSGIISFFKNYKIPDGKPEGIFGRDGKFLSVEESKEIISENYKSYLKLIENGHKDFSLKTSDKSKLSLKNEECKDANVPDYVSSFYFI